MKKNNLFEQMNRMRTLMKVKVLTEQTAALEKTAEELWNYAKRLLARGGERTSEESVGNVLKRLESLVDKGALNMSVNEDGEIVYSANKDYAWEKDEEEDL